MTWTLLAVSRLLLFFLVMTRGYRHGLILLLLGAPPPSLIIASAARGMQNCSTWALGVSVTSVRQEHARAFYALVLVREGEGRGGEGRATSSLGFFSFPGFPYRRLQQSRRARKGPGGTGKMC